MEVFVMQSPNCRIQSAFSTIATRTSSFFAKLFLLLFFTLKLGMKEG